MSESFSSSSNPCKSVTKIQMFPTLGKTLSCKSDYLYEVDVIPNDNLTSSTNLPLLNLYSEKAFFPWLKIRSLYQQKPRGVREYIAASKLDQHPILATHEEQFITLQISEDFPKQWKNLGHCPWDIECSNQEAKVLNGMSIIMGKKLSQRKWKKEKSLKRMKMEIDSSIGLLSRPGKNEFLVSYKPENWPKQIPQMIPNYKYS
ncbi:hypothetical protein H5410_060216 [Solanum commersonii]|uniref:Uncharacterized protein n=1 Tax=Solanum commersonii TaxID=4109 RepID=A0A9J5W4L3_SOLCO|nr:hypothetical protein H5410_060216 [Solanum commersonii]